MNWAGVSVPLLRIRIHSGTDVSRPLLWFSVSLVSDPASLIIALVEQDLPHAFTFYGHAQLCATELTEVMILTVITVAVLLVAAVSLVHGVTGAARDARLLKQSQKLSNGKRQLSVRNETSLVIEKEEASVAFYENVHTMIPIDDATIRLYNVSYQVGNPLKHVLRHVSLEIQPGLTAIMGPTGAGKTTLLSLLAGRLVGGRISGGVYVGNLNVLDDHDISALLQQTGYVTQLGTPWDENLTLRETLLYEAELRQPTITKAISAVDRVIAMLQMDSFADTRVGSQSSGDGLSGGQKRKLYTAIQLIHEPQVLLLDEPTSGLDASSTLALLKQLRKLAESGRTILVALHQPRREVWDLFHRVCVLAQGQVVFDGPPPTATPFLVTLLRDDAHLRAFATKASNPADAVLDVLSIPHVANCAGAVSHLLSAAQSTRQSLFEFHCAWRRRSHLGENLQRTSLSTKILRAIRVTSIVSRRMNRAVRWTWKSLFWGGLCGAVLLGVLYYGAVGLNVVSGSYVILVAPYALTGILRINALFSQKRLVLCDYGDGVIGLSHFSAASISLLSSQVACGSLLFALVPLSMMQQEFRFGVFLGFYAVSIVLESIFNFFNIMITLWPRLPFYVLQKLQFHFYLLSTVFGGVLVTRNQLNNLIGDWLLDASPIYNACAMITRLVLDDRDSEEDAFALKTFGFFDANLNQCAWIMVCYLVVLVSGCLIIPQYVNRRGGPAPKCVDCDSLPNKTLQQVSSGLGVWDSKKTAVGTTAQCRVNADTFQPPTPQTSATNVEEFQTSLGELEDLDSLVEGGFGLHETGYSAHHVRELCDAMNLTMTHLDAAADAHPSVLPRSNAHERDALGTGQEIRHDDWC